MHYISFDIATKSLAIAIIKHSLPYADIQAAHSAYKAAVPDLTRYIKLLEYANKKTNEEYAIKYLRVIDLIPDKKIKDTTTIQRTIFLHKFLSNELSPQITKIPPDERTFLIEYQMGPNDKSRVISSQILIFCAGLCANELSATTQLQLVGPSLKNKLCYVNDPKSLHSFYLESTKTNYAANKKHTKYLLQKFLNITHQTQFLHEIPKKNLDDAADAVCMVLAWIFKNSNANANSN